MLQDTVSIPALVYGMAPFFQREGMDRMSLRTIARRIWESVCFFIFLGRKPAVRKYHLYNGMDTFYHDSSNIPPLTKLEVG